MSRHKQFARTVPTLTSSRTYWTSVSPSAILLMMAFAASQAEAANFTASNQTELITAINAANSNPDASSTITLTNGFSFAGTSLPSIGKSLTIDAGGFTITTTGNGVYDVADGATVTLKGTINGSTINKGNTGTLVVEGTGGLYTNPISVNAGEFRVQSGAQVTVGNGVSGGLLVVGNNASTVATGIGSKMTANGNSRVGSTAGSTLTIEAGGTFEAVGLAIADAAGTKGTLNVTGPGSFLKGTGIQISRGTGNINITNGATVISASGGLGGIGTTASQGGTGTVIIANAGTSWTTGQFGIHDGTLAVLDGATLSTSYTRIGTTNGNSSSVLVSGKGSQFIGTLGGGLNVTEIARAGSGTLTIGDQGAVTLGTAGTGILKIAVGPTAQGTLNIGGAANEAAKVSGVLNAGQIQFGSGAGTINFNHIDAGYVFNPTLFGVGTINQIGSGRTNLNNDNSTFTGTTNVKAGTLSVNGLLGGAMNVNGGRLQGTGTVGSTVLNAAGTIAPGNSIGKLTIAGDYVGNGGLLEIETALGGDSSPTDQLKITGNSSGVTNVGVINLNGTGAPTVEGIKIIEVGGKSDGVFALQGNYKFQGRAAIVAGAYAYQLYQNGIATPGDGAWYLRSAFQPAPPVTPPLTPPDPSVPPKPTNPTSQPPTPLYQAGVPIYEAYAGVLLRLNGVSTLQQRVGNRYWGGADVGAQDHSGQQAATDSSLFNGAPAFWGRVEGGHSHIEPKTSTSSADYDLDTWKLQAGLDGQFHESREGSLIGGITLQYGNTTADVWSVYGNGKIDVDSYGVGGTLTWYGNNGFYVDGQAQATWFDSDLSSLTASQSLNHGNDAFGYAFSAETGKRIAITPNWSFTPQAQLAYSSINFDSFTDSFKARISLGNGDSLKARFGIATDYETAWKGNDGKTARARIYGIANVYHELLDGTDVRVTGVKFASENDRTWGGIGTGGSYAWGDDKYSLYGEVNLNTSLSNFADSYSVGGTAGFKVAF